MTYVTLSLVRESPCNVNPHRTTEHQISGAFNGSREKQGRPERRGMENFASPRQRGGPIYAARVRFPVEKVKALAKALVSHPKRHSCPLCPTRFSKSPCFAIFRVLTRRPIGGTAQRQREEFVGCVFRRLDTRGASVTGCSAAHADHLIRGWINVAPLFSSSMAAGSDHSVAMQAETRNPALREHTAAAW